MPAKHPDLDDDLEGRLLWSVRDWRVEREHVRAAESHSERARQVEVLGPSPQKRKYNRLSYKRIQVKSVTKHQMGGLAFLEVHVQTTREFSRPKLFL